MVSYKKINVTLLVRSALLLCACSFLQSHVSSAQANRELIDITAYVFRITLNDSTDVITAKATIQAIAKKESSSVELDLVTKNASNKGMEVLQASFNGKTIPFEHKNN